MPVVPGGAPTALAVQGTQPGPVRVALQPVRAQPIVALAIVVRAAQRARPWAAVQRLRPRLLVPETICCRNWRSALTDRWGQLLYRGQHNAWRMRGS